MIWERNPSVISKIIASWKHISLHGSIRNLYHTTDQKCTHNHSMVLSWHNDSTAILSFQCLGVQTKANRKDTKWH